MTYFWHPLQSLPLLSSAFKQLRQETAPKETPKRAEISPKLEPADGTLAAGGRCRYPTSSCSGYVMCVELGTLKMLQMGTGVHRAQLLTPWAHPQRGLGLGQGSCAAGGVDSAQPSSQEHHSILKQEQEAA